MATSCKTSFRRTFRYIRGVWLLSLVFTTTAYSDMLSQDPNLEVGRSVAEAYVSKGQQRLAITTYESLSESFPHDKAIWQRLAQLYSWNGYTKKVIVAYENINRLDPENDDIRAKLAQQYEWNGRGQEAIPHLEKLVAAQPADVSLRRRLAEQLAAAKRTSEALSHLSLVVEQEPKDVRSRFLLAQLCHWDLCWEKSNSNYKAILLLEPEHKGARKYLKSLNESQAPKAKATGQAFSDSTGVQSFTFGSEYNHPYSGRLSFHGGYLHRSLFEDPTDTEAVDNIESDRLKLGGTYKILNQLSLRTTLGATMFHQSHSSLDWDARFNLSLFNKVYSQLGYRRLDHASSTSSVTAEITYNELYWSVYSEITRQFTASTSIGYSFFSDDNRRIKTFTGLWYKLIESSISARLGLTSGYEDFSTKYVDSRPYYTADDTFSTSPGLEVTAALYKDVSLEAAYYLAISVVDGILTHNPRGALTWKANKQNSIKLSYHRYASKSYAYNMGVLLYEYRFF